MKMYVFVLTALLAFQQRDAIIGFFDPPPDYAAVHAGKVIIYGASWCGYCAKARELLQANNIDFFEYDIEKSQIGKEQHKDLGGKGVPLLLINGQVVKGYNPRRILQLAKGA